jgi:hypothetical protein
MDGGVPLKRVEETALAVGALCAFSGRIGDGPDPRRILRLSIVFDVCRRLTCAYKR